VERNNKSKWKNTWRLPALIIYKCGIPSADIKRSSRLAGQQEDII
jgi:hypothetical protein